MTIIRINTWRKRSNKHCNQESTWFKDLYTGSSQQCLHVVRILHTGLWKITPGWAATIHQHIQGTKGVVACKVSESVAQLLQVSDFGSRGGRTQNWNLGYQNHWTTIIWTRLNVTSDCYSTNLEDPFWELSCGACDPNIIVPSKRLLICIIYSPVWIVRRKSSQNGHERSSLSIKHHQSMWP